MFHLVLDKLPKLFRFLWHNVKQKLIVNLQRHPRLQLAIPNQLIDLQHRELD
jgi:hypothetical protein